MNLGKTLHISCEPWRNLKKQLKIANKLMDIQVHESEAMVIYAIMYGDCISSHRNSVSTTIYWECHGEDAMIFQDYEGM